MIVANYVHYLIYQDGISLSKLLRTTYKIIYINGIFSGCESLNEIPDISNWNVSNVKDMSYMFFGCKSSNTLPNISRWNTNNVKNN